MNSHFNDLIGKYLNGYLTAGELRQLHHLLQEKIHLDELEQRILDDLRQEWPAEADDPAIQSAIFQKLERNIELYETQHNISTIPLQRTTILTRRLLAAASVLVILTGGAFIFFRHPTPGNKQLAAHPPVHKPILPGSNKAILTLADGSEIQLDDSQKGNIANQGGIKILKLDNGILAYNGTDTTEEMMYNTIRTPRGGQYEIVLPDGTHAWMNSASTLRFPTRFAGPRREVSLSGQGYFEVAKNTSHPFIVHAGTTDIKVLGTSFDIMAYGDEPESNTTLVEGSVLVNHQGADHLLKPGQQANLDLTTRSMAIRTADIDEVIAWKNGKFQFGKSNIKIIMRQIARWYDVEIEYRGDLSDIQLTGIISRKGEVTQLLDALEETGDVHFVTENNKIIVMPSSNK